jgi:hypothetical protein
MLMDTAMIDSGAFFTMDPAVRRIGSVAGVTKGYGGLLKFPRAVVRANGAVRCIGPTNRDLATTLDQSDALNHQVRRAFEPCHHCKIPIRRTAPLSRTTVRDNFIQAFQLAVAPATEPIPRAAGSNTKNATESIMAISISML